MRALLPAALLLLVCAAAAPAAARSIDWSGYTWDVRPPGFGPPGPNHWSDAPANVTVDGSDLVLSVVRDASGHWTSAEIANRSHLGYGTYRWVVDSDLRALDAHDVLGMFTYGGAGPSHNEIDIEPSHWGELRWPTGSATVWQDAARGRRQDHTFAYSGPPPYVNQFTWRPGAVHYLIADGTGRILLDWTLRRGVPTPSTEVPMTNLWRVDGVAPQSRRKMRLASFTWLPPGARDPRPLPQAARRARRVGMTMWPRRLGTGRPAAIHWRASTRVRLRLTVQRRQRRGGFAPVTTFARSVRAGSGRMPFAGRSLRPGRYRIAVAARTGSVRCVPCRLRFTVLGR